MKIFVDFDNTIFDTRHEFLDGFFEVFAKHGVSRELFGETLSRFSKTALQFGECYSPKRHVEQIAQTGDIEINVSDFLEDMITFLNNLERHVFDDFYEFVRNFDKDDLIMLSYGEYNFQKQKIDGSGINKYFRDVIITDGDKTQEIEKYMQNFPNEDAVIIDDKRGYFDSAKQSKINIKTVHIVRENNECGNSKFCDTHKNKLDKIKIP